jgi:DNA-binding LytR/AlgR family response regulator
MSNVKILIVEDEIIIAENISVQLQKAGYTVTDTVASGEETIASIQSDKPDVILMDIRIDGPMDGIETAHQITQTGSIPVIFLTDIDDHDTLVRAGKAMPAAYLVKPFNERQVLASIHHALQNTSLKRTPAPDEKTDPTEEYYVLNNCLFLKKDRDSSFKKVAIDQILYIKAERAYSIIYTVDAQYVQSSSMNKVYDKINHPSFVQVHRSFIVNIDRIDAIKGNMLVINNVEITIGDSFKEDILKRIPII